MTCQHMSQRRSRSCRRSWRVTPGVLWARRRAKGSRRTEAYSLNAGKKECARLSSHVANRMTSSSVSFPAGLPPLSLPDDNSPIPGCGAFLEESSACPAVVGNPGAPCAGVTERPVVLVRAAPCLLEREGIPAEVPARTDWPSLREIPLAVAVCE